MMKDPPEQCHFKLPKDTFPNLRRQIVRVRLRAFQQWGQIVILTMRSFPTKDQCQSSVAFLTEELKAYKLRKRKKVKQSTNNRFATIQEITTT